MGRGEGIERKTGGDGKGVKDGKGDRWRWEGGERLVEMGRE